MLRFQAAKRVVAEIQAPKEHWICGLRRGRELDFACIKLPLICDKNSLAVVYEPTARHESSG